MIDQAVPDFSLPATGGKTFQLSAERGRMLVLYFYPKDNTPGCTTEAGQFRDLHGEFGKLGCNVYGISRDNIRSHETFKANLELPFDLLVDAEEIACTLFDVIKLKNMYGKQVRSIDRSSFLIDANGILRREWRTVKADGHATEVLAAAQSL
ncbi:MAG: peroxiredoxin [Betaproteobacteria bacterium]|nr:peroxiredoxin [Betaproteobacteria bacterium]